MSKATTKKTTTKKKPVTIEVQPVTIEVQPVTLEVEGKEVQVLSPSTGTGDKFKLGEIAILNARPETMGLLHGFQNGDKVRVMTFDYMANLYRVEKDVNFGSYTEVLMGFCYEDELEKAGE